jgi:hypothetical protein
MGVFGGLASRFSGGSGVIRPWLSHFGHFAFLPMCESAVGISYWQLEQVNTAMML